MTAYLQILQKQVQLMLVLHALLHVSDCWELLALLQFLPVFVNATLRQSSMLTFLDPSKSK